MQLINMSNKPVLDQYSLTFENKRRTHPKIWQSDYCLLKSLNFTVKKFAKNFVKEGMIVLDYGCGAKPYKIYFPTSCEYIGVDTCTNKHADIIISPSDHVPISSGTIDCIISTQVIYLIPDFIFYLKECERLLKPNGRMLITTHGTWTYHPASGGDYYRFTQDGFRYILNKVGFEIESILPVVGTLGTGLHLRQLVFNSWLKRLPLGWLLSSALNLVYNLRILFEDKLSPKGTRFSAPVIWAAIVTLKRDKIINDTAKFN